ncbi:MAG: lysoplasmalogenase [Clostridiales bacterium]|nr:lysoplasmalogenase [Clostridiales bacterium]
MMWAVFGVLFALDMVFAALYIKYGLPKVTKKSYCFKMFASGLFVVNGLIGYFVYNNGIFAKWVLLGLVFGCLGDIVIALEPFIKEGENKKKNNTIAVVCGGVLFFIGHLLYIVAFVKELSVTDSFIPALYFGIVGGIVVIAFIAFTLSKLSMGKFAIPILIYAITITSMFALSVNIAVTNTTGGLLFKIVMVVAPLFFVISDATIVFRFFDKEKFETYPMRIVNLGTYFIAQMLFGLAIYIANNNYAVVCN